MPPDGSSRTVHKSDKNNSGKQPEVSICDFSSKIYMETAEFLKKIAAKAV